ncbi:MAG: HXXEE domain-containing protein [Anaerolineales bacterium]
MGFFAGDGAWLFPVTYLAHILEEALMGDRFSFWARRITGREMSRRAFLTLNGLLLAAMTGGILLIRARQWVWLVPALGILVAVNGFGHLIGAISSRAYAPGLITGVVMWIPLGSIALLGSTIWLTPGAWSLGVVAGLVMCGLIFALGFGSSRPSG